MESLIGRARMWLLLVSGLLVCMQLSLSLSLSLPSLYFSVILSLSLSFPFLVLSYFLFLFLTLTLECITPTGNRGSFVRWSFTEWLYRTLSGKATQFEVFRAPWDRNLRLSSPRRHGDTGMVRVRENRCAARNCQLPGNSLTIKNWLLLLLLLLLSSSSSSSLLLSFSLSAWTGRANEIQWNRIESERRSFASSMRQVLKRPFCFGYYVAVARLYPPRSIHRRDGSRISNLNGSGNLRCAFCFLGFARRGKIDRLCLRLSASCETLRGR